MSPAEYEQVVRDIVEGIRDSAPELSHYDLAAGARNRLEGASGYRHQIDVSLTDKENRYYLVECKRWQARIGVEQILVLVGRGSDISAAVTPADLRMIMVSTIGATAGARKLASHFGVELHVAKSASEFGIKIGQRVRLGVYDSLQAKAVLIGGELKVP